MRYWLAAVPLTGAECVGRIPQPDPEAVMGNHWGTGWFDNDEAQVWLRQVQSDGWSALDTVLDEEESDDDLDAGEAAACLVASALIASLRDPLNGDLPSAARPALQRLQTETRGLRELESYRQRALHACERLLAEETGLRRIWAQTGDDAAWTNAVEELRDRLS